MNDVRDSFYRRNIANHIKNKEASVLICGAGNFDKSVFEAMGFKNVTISNLDSRMNGASYAPYQWAYEDAESLSFPDDSFDFVAIHAAVHHASSPHRVITEMFRVARFGVLVIESRDSLTMRLFEKLGFTQIFEHAAVYFNDCQYGGVNNTQIPNYIYRWTEREFEKTINSYAPYARHIFKYDYATAFPVSPELEKHGLIKYILLKILQPFYWAFTRIFRRQQNLFSLFIQKPSIPSQLHPWVKIDNARQLTFNREWAEAVYNKRIDVV